MDVVQDWAGYLLGDHAHPALHLVAPYLRQLSSALQMIQAIVRPLIEKLMTQPDLTTIALLVIVLFLSLKILDMLWQTFIFWARLAGRIVFWGGMVLLGTWLYSRGADGVLHDIQHWFGVWKRDYDYWVEQERITRMVRERSMPMGGKSARQAGSRWSWF